MESEKKKKKKNLKQGQIHGNSVVDVWAGVAMQETIAIQKMLHGADGANN